MAIASRTASSSDPAGTSTGFVSPNSAGIALSGSSRYTTFVTTPPERTRSMSATVNTSGAGQSMYRIPGRGTSIPRTSTSG